MKPRPPRQPSELLSFAACRGSIVDAPLSFEEYLQFEESVDSRHELIDGDILAMAGGTRRHAVLKSRLSAELTIGLGEPGGGARQCPGVGHNGHIVKETSLAHAKAHLSEIVDAAEHRGQSTLIHRHGKPSAVIVPVDVVVRAKRKKRGMTREEIAALWATFDGQGDPNVSAVEDLLAGRR